MLHEKIQSTIGLIEDVADNRQKETDNAATAKRNTTFFDSLAKLTPSITSYILARKNFSFTVQPNTYDELQDLINYSKKTFENLKAVNPTSFKQKTESFIDAISQEWAVFYKSNNSELINGLNIIVLVHPNPNVVRGCITALNRCERWPLTQLAIDSYKDARQKAGDLLKEMRFDDEIKDFLVKVRDKRATLTDLSPSILEWIKSEDISDKVSLSIKNTLI